MSTLARAVAVNTVAGSSVCTCGGICCCFLGLAMCPHGSSKHRCAHGSGITMSLSWAAASLCLCRRQFVCFFVGRILQRYGQAKLSVLFGQFSFGIFARRACPRLCQGQVDVHVLERLYPRNLVAEPPVEYVSRLPLRQYWTRTNFP